MFSPLPSKKALICLNGQPPKKQTVQRVASAASQMIATDGGCNWLMDYDILPDLVIGDLDSIAPEHLRNIPSIRIEDQYSTDLEKALTYVLEQGITDIDLLGLEAGRVDHMLANFFLLWPYAQKINIRLVGDDWLGFFLGRSQNFECAVGSTFSIIPFSACSGVTLKGFEYNLDNALWTFGQVGVSNVVQKTQVNVAIERGKALALVFDVNAICQKN